MKNESHHALLCSRLQEFREDGIPSYSDRIFNNTTFLDFCKITQEHIRIKV